MQKPCKVVNAFGLKSWYCFQIHGKAFHVSGSGLIVLYFWVSLLLIKSLMIHSKFLLIPAQSCLRKEKWMAAVTYCCLFFFLLEHQEALNQPCLWEMWIQDIPSEVSCSLSGLAFTCGGFPPQFININLVTCLNNSFKLLGGVKHLSHLVRCRL